MGELYENDNKINELLLNKMLQFENENKDLKEKNKNIETDVEVLKKSMKTAQKEYKILKEEEEDLHVKLQSTKKAIQQNEAEFSEMPRRKRRKTTEGHIDNRNLTSKNCFVNEGLLVIRNLF